MKAVVKLRLKAEKKHSVRYDATSPDLALSTVYINKDGALGHKGPYPETVTVTVEWAE